MWIIRAIYYRDLIWIIYNHLFALFIINDSLPVMVYNINFRT